MPFSNFTNPYQNPVDVPLRYGKHPNLSKLFKVDASYVRPAEDPVTIWAIEILETEYNVPVEVTEANARVERMILGEEDVA